MQSQKILVTGGSGYIGNYILKLGANKYPEHQFYSMSRSGKAREDSMLAIPNIKYVQGDCLDTASYPAELADCDSVIHTVGTLVPGRTPATSYESMNYETARTISQHFNSLTPSSELKRSFIMISSEKAPPFLHDYITTKLKAEKFLMEECLELQTTILRPGFVYNKKERGWSIPLKLLVDIGYHANTQIVSKVPGLGSAVDFLFPAKSVSLETVGDVSVRSAVRDLDSQLWTNDMLLSYQPK